MPPNWFSFLFFHRIYRDQYVIIINLCRRKTSISDCHIYTPTFENIIDLFINFVIRTKCNKHKLMLSRNCHQQLWHPSFENTTLTRPIKTHDVHEQTNDTGMTLAGAFIVNVSGEAPFVCPCRSVQQLHYWCRVGERRSDRRGDLMTGRGEGGTSWNKKKKKKTEQTDDNKNKDKHKDVQTNTPTKSRSSNVLHHVIFLLPWTVKKMLMINKQINR